MPKRDAASATRNVRSVTVESLEPRMLLSAGPRQMEYLGRGVVATRSSSTKVFVSWRSLALDPATTAFNVYRSTNAGTAAKLNSSPVTGGTNFTDSTASSTSSAYSYFVKPVLNGVEQAASGTYTLPANAAVGPEFSLPLRNIGDYHIRHISVGDLDGDGEYDFVVDRIPNQPGLTEKIEAYRRDGTFLWSVDCGPNSLDLDNIEPGSSAIDVGNWDGVTVYDLDGDGKAEVYYRSANGVVFGDGTNLTAANDNLQYISVLNGMTGAERARIQVPTDYLSDGPMGACFGVGYLDGVHPSLVAKMKNRHGSGDFNQMFVAYDFNGTSITQKWKYLSPVGTTDYGHQIRIVDVDGDGKDDIADTAQVLNGDGTLKYSMASQGVGHGDRFYIGDLDPDRPGLEGYAIQQNNPSGLIEFYYDAGTGEILHKHFISPTADAGRGVVGDIDPSHRGYEYWSFYGLYNSSTPVAGQPPVETKIADDPNRPWPNFRVWWDGDVLSENLNNTVIDKWDPATQSTNRLTTLYHYGSPTATDGEAPVFYGDIMGDWREEVIFEQSDHAALDIYTTQYASSTRLYTLAQNPEYRNSLTVKGYLQSNMLDYYLGDGMATPPTPNITVHAPTAVIVPPSAPTGLTAAVAPGGTQVNLTWTAIAGAASYKVRRGTSNGGPYALVGTTTGTSFADTSLAPNGGTYYYVVTQVTSSGAESTPSNQASVTIGQPATSDTYQAEDGTVSGGTVIANNASGYAGTGFADFPNSGGALEWDNVSGGGGGTATFTFRYAQGATGTRTGRLTIDGVSQNITFSWTGGWNTWETLTVTAPVTPGGTNTVRLESTGQNLANIDQMQVDVPAPPYSYTGGSGADRYYVRRNGGNIDVWVDSDGTGLPTYSLIYASTPSLSFVTGAGDDSLTLDLSGGNPVPAPGVSFDGGAGTDTVAVVGSGGADTFTFNASSIVLGSTVALTAVERRTLNGNGGTDHLAVNGGAVALAGPLTASSLNIADGAALDLKTFALAYEDDAAASPVQALSALVASGRNGGTWDGTGIVTSSAAANDYTTLGVARASEALGLSGTQTALWKGQTVDAESVLVMYTYGGDANLDGQINIDDYTQIDSSVSAGGALKGWYNGDFNYDGNIDIDDYTIIDSNIGIQGTPL